MLTTEIRWMSEITLKELASELKEILRYVKKLEHSNKSLRGSIATCKKTMREHGITHRALVSIYRKTADRMREIELDYNALSKIHRMTVTFFERRNKKGEWCVKGHDEEEKE